MRRRFPVGQWARWVVEQAESGRSIAAFCAERQIGVQSFYLWKRKLAGKDSAPRTINNDQPPLVAVSLTGLSQVTIELPCGATIRIPPDDAAMRRVIEALLHAGGAR